MKTTFKDIALVALLVILCGLTIRTCNLDKHNRELQSELDSSNSTLAFLQDHPVIKTDTVFKDSASITLPRPHQNVLKPSKVTHPKESKSIREINPDTQGVSEENLVNIGTAGLSLMDSLAGFDLNKNKITLTFSNTDFGYHTAEYQIKPTEYNYIWVDGKLTAKRLPLYKRLEVKPNISLSYRPFHNLWDLDAGLSFKTKSLNYNLGINAFYYPRWQSQPGIDAQIRITYNF